MTDQTNTASEEARTKSSSSLLADVMTHVSTLVRKEFDLARAEMNENASKAMKAIGMLVAAGVIALTALTVLSAALVAAIAEAGIEEGWAALIVGVIFAIIAAILMRKGMNDLQLSSLAPTRTARNVKRDADAVKESYNG